jgi:hypothetical protein
MIRVAALLALLAQDSVTLKSGDTPIATYQVAKPPGSKLAVESACYFHPFQTPKGIVITDVAPDDHKHHRGIFLAWLEMHGKKDADFWGWGRYAPMEKRQIVNREAANHKESTVIKNDWMADGETLLKEELKASARIDGPASVLDLVYTLSADADLKLPKWAFSGFCLRMRKDGKAEAFNPDGPVKLPAPNHMKPESDWPAASWYDYTLTLPDGTVVGGAVIDHPKNPPPLWHNAMSIRMLNPCIVAPKEMVMKANEPLVLRYRVVAHDSPASKELLDKLAAEWAKQ